MTANTEQLHQLLELVLTELDSKAIPIAYMQDIDRKGKAFIEQAANHLQVVHDGYVVVPVTPTLPMLKEAQRVDCYHGLMNEWLQDEGRDFIAMYRAAIAAAPQPLGAQHGST